MKSEIVVTGGKLTGYGFRSIRSTMRGMIKSAKGEILVIAYTITNHGIEILELLEDSLKKGVMVSMVINDHSTMMGKVRKILKQMKEDYEDHFHIRLMEKPEELHAKVLIVDRKELIIGSANLSQSGLLSNHEIALWIEDRAMAQEAREVFNRLFHDSGASRS